MIIWNVIEQSLLVTAFVTMMMLAIEYVNVATGGEWLARLAGGKWGQYILGAVLGVLPGCLGAFAMVSLYSHRRVTLGAIVTTMIATSGDEAFVMLAMFPKTAVLVFAGLAVFGLIAGRLTDVFIKGKKRNSPDKHCGFETHNQEWKGALTPRGRFMNQWRSPSAIRGVLTVCMGLFLVTLIAYRTGFIQHGPGASEHNDHGADIGVDPHDHDHQHEHDHQHDHHGQDVHHQQVEDNANPVEADHHGHSHGSWEWITLAILTLFGLFIVTTVSDHFLDEHLWKHVLKVHVPRIFLWTLGAIAAITALDHFIDLEALVQGNIWLVLLIAIAVGMIPESGPHLIFVSLFATGSLPLSVLVASCVVQDGHGMVPMLAHSRKDFFAVKGINAAVGLAVGASMLLAGL